MEEKKLRQYDFVTALVLIIFSFWELAEAFKMPMKESYGGVQNNWYVSPALLPIFIGLGVLLLGSILLINSIKTGGAKTFIESMKGSNKLTLSVPTKRVLTVVLGLFSFIFLLIPNVDFFLSISLFLYFVISVFLPNIEEFRKKMVTQFIIAMGILLILILTGLNGIIIGLFAYTFDILALFYIIYLNIISRIKGAKFQIPSKTFRTITIVSIAVPLILCPLFRYFLLVPLPVEGGIIKLINLLYYTFR